MLIATGHWPYVTRFCIALRQQHFDLLVLAPSDHAVHRMEDLYAQPLNRSRGLAANIKKMVEDYSPALLIPTDERALLGLHKLYRKAKRSKAGSAIADLIRHSIGDEITFLLARKKSQFVDFAVQEGIRTPKVYLSGHPRYLLKKALACPLPAVVKQDDSGGGLSVRYAETHGQIANAIASLGRRSSRLVAIIKSIAYLDTTPLKRLWERPPTISVQQYILGVPANRLVLCRQGKVLAGLSVEVLQTHYNSGPATVVRVINNAEMEEGVTKIIHRLGLSGFAGFDLDFFILPPRGGQSLN
jgi:hypothetical protein